MRYFVAIDFDGTVAETDIVDAVLEEFAHPKWHGVEKLWAQGVIGSRECLWQQVQMVEASLEEVSTFLEKFSIDYTFLSFLQFLRHRHWPFAIISDGFELIVRQLLARAGVVDVTIYANQLVPHEGRLMASFPYANPHCHCGTCKRLVSRQCSQGLPVILVGDGRSDFCLANEAQLVFAKKKLLTYCREHFIAHRSYNSFSDVENCLANMTDFASLTC